MNSRMIFDGRSATLRQSNRGSSGHQRSAGELLADAQRQKLLRRAARERIAAVNTLGLVARRVLAVRRAADAMLPGLQYTQGWQTRAARLMFVASRGRSLRRDLWTTLEFTDFEPALITCAQTIYGTLTLSNSEGQEPTGILPDHLASRLLLMLARLVQRHPETDGHCDAFPLLLEIAVYQTQPPLPLLSALTDTISRLVQSRRPHTASVLVQTTLHHTFNNPTIGLGLEAVFIGFFSIPGLVKHTLFPSHLVYNLLYLIDNKPLAALDTLPDTQILTMLKNVIALDVFPQDRATSPPVRAVIFVLSKLLVKLPSINETSDFSGTLSETEFDSDASSDYDDGAPSNGTQPRRSTWSRADHIALTQAMAPIFNDNILRSLLEEALPPEFDDSVPVVMENSNATRLASFFQLLPKSKRSVDFKIVTMVAFGTARSAEPNRHLLVRLWRACQAPRPDEFENPSPRDLLVEPVSKTMGNRVSLFELFCKSYAQLLTVSDEDEIYDHQRVFSVEQMRQVAAAIRDVLFMALYVPPSSQGKYLAIFDGRLEVAEAASRLLSLLRICDERRPFADSELFWFPRNSPLGSDKFIDDAATYGCATDKHKSLKRRRMAMASGRKILPTGPEEQQESVIQLLRLAPFFIPFRARAAIFAAWVEQDRENVGELNVFGGLSGRWVTIRRPYLFEDAVSQLGDLRSNLKQRIRINFEDEHGLQEVGIDGGGVFKEFMHEFMAGAFSSMYGLFKETEQGQVYPEPASGLAMPDHLALFQFLGNMLGKALSDGVTVKLQFAPFFLNRILGRHNFLDDLKSLDSELHKNLQFVKCCQDDGAVEDLGLNFVIVDNNYGEIQEIELIANGKDVGVVYSNRLEYIDRVANYRLNRQIKQQSEYFMRGLGEMIPIDWVRIFGEQELQELISGREGPIDLVDLRRNCSYSGGYSADSPTIKWLWQAVSEFSAEEQSRLLRFVSSSPRAPLLGFRSLNPPFCVHRAESDGGTRLPSASTCMNLLKLPEYGSYGVTREKLLMAIENYNGFGLS